jgi:ribose/xylose/arabinose/galactoside ABC-type transport system permease subunit
MKIPALARSLGPLVGLLAAWLLFALLAGPAFRSIENQKLMLLQTTVVAVAAVGATLIIASGGIDLSVGSSIALTTVVVALLLRAGVPTLPAALGGIVAGLLCGAAIGAMVVGHLGRVAAVVGGAAMIWWAWERWGPVWSITAGAAALLAIGAAGEFLLKRLPLSPFIVTLGMWGALRGLAKGLGDNQPVYPADPGWLPDLMTMPEHGLASVLPPAVWVLAAVAVGMAALLRYTVFGRHALAIGSNETAARMCGLAVDRVKLWVYIVGVGCAGIAGILQFGYLSMGDPTTAGGYELKAIAAVVIGGASLSGGHASIAGTIIGALIMTVVDTGCTKLDLDSWVQEIVTGAIIVGAVAIDRLRQSRG